MTDAGPLSKAVFVAVATGQNPRDFGGRNLVAALQALQDADSERVGSTLFAHAYALLALHNAGEPISDAAAEVLTSQVTEDGGWALFGGTTPGTADTNTHGVGDAGLGRGRTAGRGGRGQALPSADAE